eukprot:scaffold909_cov575-Prasinococcus_capsulatus_cf.AAC.14
MEAISQPVTLPFLLLCVIQHAHAGMRFTEQPRFGGPPIQRPQAVTQHSLRGRRPMRAGGSSRTWGVGTGVGTSIISYVIGYTFKKMVLTSSSRLAKLRIPDDLIREQLQSASAHKRKRGQVDVCSVLFKALTTETHAWHTQQGSAHN